MIKKLKSDNYSDLVNRSENAISELKKTINESLDKSDIMEKRVLEVKKHLDIEKLNSISEDIEIVNDAFKVIFNEIGKLRYDEISVEKPVKIENVKPNDQFGKIQSMKPQPNVVIEPAIKKEQSLKELDNFSKGKEIKPKASNYLILAKSKNKVSEFIIYNGKSFSNITIDKSHFVDESLNFSSLPENCRIVNIGNALIATGGLYNRGFSALSFRCDVIPSNLDSNSHSISISNLQKMIEARDRHSLTHLENLSSVIACSGFFSKSVEILNLNENKWSSLPDMNESRGNSTSAYISNRYLYVFGGYRQEGRDGAYLNSAEYLDMTQTNAGWKFVNFERKGLMSFKLCTAGLTTLSNNKILICGGYDGQNYSSNVLEMEFDTNGEISRFEEAASLKLPSEQVLFSACNFIKIGYNLMNFDSFSSNVISYDIEDEIFSVIRQ